MGNKNTKKHKKDDIHIKNNEEEYYSEMIKNLKVDTDKIENNLKKYKDYKNYIVLIESGALAPPHKMHLGLMENAKKHIEGIDNTKKVIGGYLIPSSDRYVKIKLKKDFIPLNHRVNMTKLITKNSDWLESLDWGFAYGEEIKMLLQLILNKKFNKYNIKCILVFGMDYYLRGKFHLKDVHICVCRPGYDINEVKKYYQENIIFVEGSDENISSTKLRKAIREKDEKLINEITSQEVVDYINKNNIFNERESNNNGK